MLTGFQTFLTKKNSVFLTTLTLHIMRALCPLKRLLFGAQLYVGFGLTNSRGNKTKNYYKAWVVLQWGLFRNVKYMKF